MDDETIKESAKAAQEVAKTTSKAIESGRAVGRFLNKVFGKAIVNTVGLYWTDRVTAKRIEAAIYDWKRLTILAERTENELQSRRVKKIRPLPPKILLPLLEHATIEHEKSLQEMWAKLLAAALDPTEDQIRKAYVDLLGEMNGRDARVLQSMFAEWYYWRKRELENEGDGKKNRYSSGIDAIGTHDESSVVLFYRHGVMLPVATEVEEYTRTKEVRASRLGGGDAYVEGGEAVLVAGDLSLISFTEFGEAFCLAVIGDVSHKYKPRKWAEFRRSQ